jgi:hypothetical protein
MALNKTIEQMILKKDKWLLLWSYLGFMGFMGFMSAQSQVNRVGELPLFQGTQKHGTSKDWLITKLQEKAEVYRNEDNNELILSNGLISLTFRLSPNISTIGLKVLDGQQEHIRAVKPEAIIFVNGFTIDVGGLQGQPNLAFLYPNWLDELKTDPLSFKFLGE